MLTRDELGRVRVVLVGARNPNNIGAAARAMQDFGFSDLRLVNEYKVALETAVSAVGAADVLKNAVDAASVADAVAGCQLVVGTTAVGERGIEHRLLGLVEGAAAMRQGLGIREQGLEGPGPALEGPGLRAQGPEGASAPIETQIPFGDDNKKSENFPRRVALLFGSEKTGLTNEALSYCDWLVTVPMHQPEGERHLSMNLGQAVAVCLWELVRGPSTTPSARSARSGSAQDDKFKNAGPSTARSADAARFAQDDSPVRAKAEEVERVVEMLREVMRETEYNRRFPASCDETTVRRFVHRMGLEAKDAQAWMGILRQVMWRVGKKGE